MLEISSLLRSPDHIKMLSRRDSLFNVLERMEYGICLIFRSIPKILARHTRQLFVSTVNLVKVEFLGSSKKISNSISLAVFKSHSLESYKLLPSRKARNSLLKKSSMHSQMRISPPRRTSNLVMSIKSELLHRARHLRELLFIGEMRFLSQGMATVRSVP